MNLPTWLTTIRLLLVPLVVIFFYLPIKYSGIYAGLVFIFIGITDFLDGYLARKYNLTTRFGAFLDPVADKVLVVTALLLVAEDNHSIFITIPAIIIISRELTVSSLREWLAEIGQGHLAVSWIGKAKTNLQIIAIAGLLAFNSRSAAHWDYGDYFHYFFIFVFYVATFFTLWSLVDYLKLAKNTLLKKVKS